MTSNHTAKIVFLDIETAPTLAWIWKRFKENISLDQVEKDGYILCACWKDINSNKVYKASIPDTEKPTSDNDKEVVKKLWKVLDDADIIVAHNGKKFDIPTINARFIYWGLPPPSPYKVVDTLRVLKSKFRFPVNSLDGICQHLNMGKKHSTSFKLWSSCIHGDKKAWKQMVDYCAHDVILLNQLYNKFKGWIDRHPNVNLYNNNGISKPTCEKCGSHNMHSRGTCITTTQTYKKYQCQDCGGWSRARTAEPTKTHKQNILTHI